MPTKLDRLLASLNPERVLDETFARADRALNTFPMPAASITEWQDFRKILVRFLRHGEHYVLRLPAPIEMPLDFDWGRCVQLLCRRYGTEGEKNAFELARTGNEGGVYAVIKALARSIAEHYSENEIAARVLDYWNGLSVPEQLAAPDEYLKKFGHLLPSEITEDSAARIRAKFWQVLQEHPRMIQRLGRVGR